MEPILVTQDQIVTKGQVIGRVSDMFYDPDSNLPPPQNYHLTTFHLHFEIDDEGMTVSPYMSLVESYRRLIGPIAVTIPVRATTTLPVHTTPGGSSSTLIPMDAVGTVVGGPQTADWGDYCWKWWRVDWGDGIVGWVVNNYLVAIQCIPLTTESAVDGVAQTSCGTPLSVTLSASPSSGSAPLNDVNLTVSVSGSATSPVNYTFYCNRSDNGTNITSGYAARYTGTSANPKTAMGVCDYQSPGTYTAKVIVERGSAVAEARTTVTVSSSGGSVPTVSTLAETSVTQASVAFNATVHPNNSTTTFWFDYGTSTSVNQSTATHNLAAATSPSAVSLSQGGLSCNRQYFYRARASNSGGFATPGSILSFTTDACGSGGPQSIELIVDKSFEAGNNAWWVANPDFYIDDEFDNARTGDFYAYLTKSDGTAGNNLSGGMISPEVTIPDDATDADLRFYYSIDTQETTSSSIFDKVDVYLVRSGSQLTKIATISNLDHTGTSYVSKSVDLSSSFYGDEVQIFFAGSTNGSRPTKFRIDDVSLEVDVPSGGPPEATTNAADQVSSSSARLNMTVDPNGADTEIWFDLEPGDSSPSDDTDHLNIGTGSGNRTASISVFGLECGTKYYFRAHAENSYDRADGSVRNFTTSACSGGAPHADTDPAENITQTSATLRADVDPNGLPTQAWFAWGESPSLGQDTPHVSLGSGTGNVDFSQTLSGLACGTTYYFENHAQNSADHDDGATLEFTTLPCDGGGSPAQGFFLENRHQGCSGGGPAVLLWWTAPAGMSNVFTVRRTDGAYTATVDASQGGMVHLVSSLLVPGETYSFYIEGTLDGVTVQTNAVTVPVVSDECRLPVGAGELPHLPLVWTDMPFCSGGTASLPILWTAVGGAATYTLTRIDNVAAQLTPYPNLTGTGMTDTGLIPGAAYEYMLEAVGSGGARQANRFTVFVPSGICGEPSTPGPFSAQVSTPVCNAGKGAVTLSWTSASGAGSETHRYWADDGFRHGSGTTQSGSSKVIDEIRPGALFKLMVQKEAATTPRQYRSVIMSQRIPLDICGAGTLPPAVTTTTAPYIQENQALLHATVIPNADSSVAFFEWGTTTNYGSTTPLRNAGNGYRSERLGETLTGLACNTTYYFRVHASNPVGQTTGVSSSFTTLPCSNVVCYPLLRSVNDPDGGSFPVPSPSQSAGCPSGQYTASQTIQVTASPASGWQVGNWAGTQNNSSTSTVNTVVMPASQHAVHVNYVRHSTTPLDFYTVTPCRIVDTRQDQSALSTGSIRTFAVVGACGVPPEARAASFNVTAAGATAGGYMTLFPADQSPPQTSTVSFGAGQNRANNAVLGLSADGRIGAVAALGAGQSDLVIDVNGYFAIAAPSAGQPTFTRISDMTNPRFLACAAKLGNGKVLIAGGTGTGRSNPLSSAELYDPATRTFAPTGSMNVSRGRPACVTLPDGRVLVGGGATAPFTFTDSAEVYNPATGTFTAVGNMTTPRGEGWHALAVPGGALLFGGTFEGSLGTATAAVDRFDAGSNSFSRIGTLSAARRDYNAQMLSDGTTLLVGGVLRYDLPVSITAELYNVSTNQPISIGQPNSTLRSRSWSSAILPGGDVLVTSGAGVPSEIYRRSTRSFEALTDAPAMYGNDFAGAIALSDGKVILFGYGRVFGQGGRVAEIFDPAGGTFTTVGPMAFENECPGFIATPLNDGTVLITGGGTSGNCEQGVPVAEIFNPNGV